MSLKKEKLEDMGTLSLLFRLRRNFTVSCMLAIWIVHTSVDVAWLQKLCYALIAFIVLLDAWDKDKVIKQLETRYTELSNHH